MGEITGAQAHILLRLLLLPVTWPFVLASLLFRPLVRLVERTPRLAPARPDPKALAAELARRHADSDDPLLRGDRRAAAEATWPAEAYPTLYMDVPDDLARPAAMDGRLFGGVGVPYLAEREITEGDVADAAYAGKVAQRAFILASAAVLLLVGGAYLANMAMLPITKEVLGRQYLVSSAPMSDAAKVDEMRAEIDGLRSQDTDPLHVSWPDMKPIELPSPEGSGFLAGAWAGAKALGLDLLYVLMAYVLPLLVAAASMVPIAWAVGKVVPVRYLAGLLARKGARYAMPTKDSFVRFQHRTDVRNRALASYAKQLNLATGYQALDPLIGLGRTTGSLRHRGDQTAPIAGQTLSMDYSSLFQHLIVFGGTGENKTAGILKPMFRQLLETRSPAGNPLGFFVIDAKAVLWKDFLPKVERAGRMGDVRVIGFGDDQWGVDLLGGLDPMQAAAVLRTIMDQQGGGGGKDPFWSNSAADIFRHLLVLANAYRWTRGGQEEWIETGINPYSIGWVFRAVCSPAVWDTALQHVFKSMVGEEYELIGRRINSETLWSSVDWLSSFWFSLAETTKSGVVGQVSQILDVLASNEEIRERFACGAPHPHGEQQRRVLEIGEALDGRIVMVAVSALEHGAAAKAILMFLKSGLFRAARLRETEIGKDACQAKPCVFVADEFQELVSSDTSGLSDGTFWNVARSTGVAGIVATQTMASLAMALGNEKATDNLVAQFRSKVILRVEDCSSSKGESMTTLEVAQALAGKYERCRSFEKGQYESLDAQHAVTGWHPVLTPAAGRAVPPGEREELAAGGLAAVFSPVLLSKHAGDPYSPEIAGVDEKLSLYEVDDRWVNDGARASLANQSWLQHAMQVEFRREDQHRQTVASGIEVEPGITPTDILSMGRWFAYAHLQRAGARVHDIIELEPDYDTGQGPVGADLLGVVQAAA